MLEKYYLLVNADDCRPLLGNEHRSLKIITKHHDFALLETSDYLDIIPPPSVNTAYFGSWLPMC